MKLTKRELFALRALQSLIAKHPAVVVPGDSPDLAEQYREVARGARAYADALIKELEVSNEDSN